MFDTDDRVIRLNIKTDRDLHYVLVEANVNPPKIYVSVQEVRYLQNNNKLTNAQPLHQQLNEAWNQSFVQLLAQMKSGVGSNDGNDQSFVEGSVHEDQTIEKDDSEEANSEDNDSHNSDYSYSTDHGNFNIDSVADVYENVGFGNNPVERDEIDDVGFG